MKQITFNRDFEFALDGINMTRFHEGETHTVPSSCADSAIQEGAAMRIDVEAPCEPQKIEKQPEIIIKEIPENELGKPKATAAKASRKSSGKAKNNG